MMEYSELMKVMDQDDTSTLYRLENDLFDTVLLVYNEGEANEQGYALTDMQGAFPKNLDEVADYEWVRVEDVDW